MEKRDPMLGIMLDCSRCAVLKTGAVKQMILYMEKMGYNTLLLYLEDTYEIPEEPFFGYLRGRYSQAELEEIDRFSAIHGIELIPCIQTLAHLQPIFRWEEYGGIQDIGDILLAGEPRTMELIENMFRAMRACVRTRRIHIGMDEAFVLGRGQYYNKHGHRDKLDVFLTHLRDVCRLAEKYDFEPMIWGDMFFRFASGGEYYGGIIPPETAVKARKLLPENLRLVYFDYHNKEKEIYKQMLQGFRSISDNVIFGGASWTWAGFAPWDGYAFSVTEPALAACREEGVSDVFITAWGDNGGECSPMIALPEFWYAAELYRGNTDMESIKEKFRALFGEEFDAVRGLSRINYPPMQGEPWAHSSTKAFLYNDVLLGIYDTSFTKEMPVFYRNLAEEYRTQGKETKLFCRQYRVMETLAEALAVKAEVAVSLRAAYKSDNRAALDCIARELLPMLQEKLKKFFEAFRTQWDAENKPFGFDIHEIRMGGLLMRCDSAQKRLTAYLAGETDRIDELEETILPTRPDGVWKRAASVSLDL